MKIAYITAGTGGAFYCENCIRDNALISGLKAIGHEVITVPMYLSIKDEEDSLAESVPIFFGAVRLYLTDKFPVLKSIPVSLLHFLDHKSVLNLAASIAGSTRARGHEEMTLSILQGEQGKFADEFDKLTDWLFHNVNPDAVFISNAFLLGIASAVKAKGTVPVICMLQDEHTWVDGSAPEYQKKIWNTIAEKFRYVDISLTHSNWYADKIKNLLHITRDQIAVIPFGVDPANYIPSTLNFDPVSIGYLGRVCWNLGVETLTNAYCQILTNNFHQKILLSFCGGFTKDDLPMIRKCKNKISCRNGSLAVHHGFGLNARSAYLSSLSMFSIPSQEKMTIGTSVIEAMASGVPVIQPDEGGFSEVIKETGGGKLFSPNSPDALADAILDMISDKDKLIKLGARGRKAVINKHNNINMANEAIKALT